MSNIADIANKLIRLATNNPSEEEAKLAALKACVIINQHKLLVRRESPDPEVANNERNRVWRENQREEHLKKEVERVVKMREEARKNMWKKIVLQSRHQCSKCEEVIPIDTEVMWSKGGTGIFHMKCWVEYSAGV